MNSEIEGVELPAEVRRVVSPYLQLMDEAFPGRIHSFYLVGSVALGDYRPGASDIDFVAVSNAAFTDEEIDRLATVHQTLRHQIERPYLDGIYITHAQLACNPEEIDTVPSSLEGSFHRTDGFEANPITWLILRKYPVNIRGPRPTPWYDAEVVRRWTLNNLNTYWAGLASQLQERAATLPDERISQVLTWCVPGVLRLAYTLDTGDVISKSGACRYGLERLTSRWYPVITMALSLRANKPPPAPISHGLVDEAVSLLRHIIGEENSRARGCEDQT